MPLRRAALIGVAVTAGGLASAPAVGAPNASALHLPAPVTVQAGSGRFQIERDGHIRKLPPVVVPFPHDAAYFPGTGVWYAMRHRHLVVGRWRRALWRSQRLYPRRFNVGVVIVSHDTVAFSYRSAGAEWLYVSSLEGHERRIARNEYPLGWTTGGFYTYRYAGRELLLRSVTGSLEATVSRWPATYAYDQLTENVFFIARGKLTRALGAAATPIASLQRLGFAVRRPNVMVMPLGSLVALLTNGRLIMLRNDGSLFARTRLPDPHGGIASLLAVSPDAGTVAYTATSRDSETVYLLRQGARAAIALHTERVDLGGCGRGVGLQWHGRWLLYGTSTGNAAVIDGEGRRRTIELTPVVDRLAGADSRFSVYWSGQPPLF